MTAAIYLLSATFAYAQERGLPAAIDFPTASVAETRSLEFHVAPATAGSLDAQVRAALRELARRNRNAALVKLRVFAVGAAALDSSRLAIARALAHTNAPLPVLSLVGAAGFPDTTQLVEIESTAAGGHALNPQGVGFIAGVASPAGDRTVAGLARVAREAGIPSANVLRISCFYERADQVAPARAAIATAFPTAEASFVFSYAASSAPAIECEAVARLAAAPATPRQYFNLPGVPASPNYAHAALVATRTVVFADAGMALDATDSSMHAMLERTKTAVARYGASLSSVVMGDNYWLTDAARDTLRLVRTQYFGGTVPAATGVFFTSLASEGASAALELVVAIE
jgi:enamine deaminase RidA (YjgF/YER057c/UK114 family)